MANQTQNDKQYKNNKQLKIVTSDIQVNDFNSLLKKEYMKKIENFFWDEKNSLKFLSSVSYLMQSNEKLRQCTQESLINCFLKCMELEIFPWTVSWEVFIIPYKNKIEENWEKFYRVEAQFQMWYQWFVTIFYRAWIQKINAQIVYEKDDFSIDWFNDVINHKISTSDRWEAVWVYVVAIYWWQKFWYFMPKNQVLYFRRFSKSYDEALWEDVWKNFYSPWNPKNDPELNMWKKTCLKQLSKYLPKNKSISKALEFDNEESSIIDYHNWKKRAPEFIPPTPDQLDSLEWKLDNKIWK